VAANRYQNTELILMKLYKAKTGTPHIVREIERIREFTKGEGLENTAPLIQVVAQRQKETDVAQIATRKGILFSTDDRTYPKFCMLDTTFHELYEEI